MTLRVVLILGLAAWWLRADDPAQTDPKLVDLSVVALDSRNQPVTDLTADDFQVTDAGKPQKLAFFRRNRGQLEPAVPPSLHEFSNRAAAAPPYATVILFDLMNEGFASRGVATNQIVRTLEPLESADTLYLYLVTLDGRLVAVRGLPAEGAPAPTPDGAPWTRRIKPLMDEAMRAVLRIRPVDVDVAMRVPMTFGALDMLAVQLSRIPGRKNVVWVTDGVPIALGPNRSDTGEVVDFTPLIRKLSDSMERSGIALYPVRQVMLGSPDRIGDTSGAGQTGGAGTGEQSIATLDEFADITGGRRTADKDIQGALKQATGDLRSSYQIGYFPPPKNWDNKFHKLRVTSKRKGVRIQTKTGYYAWAEPAGTRAQEAIGATATAAFDAAEIGLRATATQDAQDARGARLDVRVDAADITLTQDGDHYAGQLRVGLIGYMPGGLIETMPVSSIDLRYSAAERDQALKDGIPLVQHVSAANGEIKFRVIVFDRGSNAVGSVTVPAGDFAKAR